MSPSDPVGGTQEVSTSEDLERELNRARTKAWVTGQAGETIRFRAWDVVRLLGRGGMGGVFLARAPELDRNVALKLVGASAIGADRLAREARALAQIDHPNVVKVHAVDLGGPAPVIEMAYVEGLPLSRWLRSAPPLRSVVEAYVAAGEGLAAIHAAGLVHRDLKPDNILRKPDGGIVVVDLGLAIDEHTEVGPGERGGGRVSSGTALAGTPGYIAPEVLLGDRPTAAADQFSLACALYDSVAGALPFDASGARDTYLEEIRRGVPASEPKAAPRWLRRVLQRGLQFDSARRYPTADAFRVEFQRGLERRTRWWRLGGLAMALVPVASLGWVAAHRPARCPGADAFLTPSWNGPCSRAASRPREQPRRQRGPSCARPARRCARPSAGSLGEGADGDMSSSAGRRAHERPLAVSRERGGLGTFPCAVRPGRELRLLGRRGRRGGGD